jgi:Ca2+-binding RTX toxin-like protein
MGLMAGCCQSGDDVLTGGAGYDQFAGGAGSDRHVAGSGLDVLTDFESGPGGDVLDLRIFGFADLEAVVAITSNNTLGAVIQIADGDTINILGVAAGDLNDTNVPV